MSNVPEGFELGLGLSDTMPNVPESFELDLDEVIECLTYQCDLTLSRHPVSIK